MISYRLISQYLCRYTGAVSVFRLLVCGTILSALPALGAEQHISLEYKWTEGKIYRYIATIEIGQKLVRKSVVKHVCLSSTNPTMDEPACLAVQTKLLQADDMAAAQKNSIEMAQEIISFVGVDKRGAVTWQDISWLATDTQLSPNLVSLIVHRGLGDELWIHLPDLPVKADEIWIDTTKRFRFQVSKQVEDQSIVRIVGNRISPHESSASSQVPVETWTVDFDFRNSQLRKARYQCDDGLVATLTLDAVIDASGRELATLKDAREKAMSENTFIRANCLPSWRRTDVAQETRRELYWLLSNVKDDQLRTAVLKDALTQDMGDITFHAFADISSAAALETRNWALCLLVETTDGANKDVSAAAHDRLCEISGLQLQSDGGRWREWLTRLRQGLPKLLESNIEDMKAMAVHDDPWVRLFVLRQLSTRQGVDLVPILEKATYDTDEKIRLFAGATLKRLKKEKN